MAAIKTKQASKRSGGRVKMVMPPGNILNLAGLEKIRGFGDNMEIPKMRGSVEIDGEAKASAVNATDAVAEHNDNTKLITGLGTGKSQVLIQPLYLSGALLNGLPSPSEEMGVVLPVGGQRYFFNVALLRGEQGHWSPMPGAPAQHQWHIVDAQGRAQHPDVVKKVFDLLLRAVELYYRRFYRDFVLAELAWFNNTILEYEAAAELVRLNKATPEVSSAFYAARFSGHMKTMREGEVQVLQWLKNHPESI